MAVLVEEFMCIPLGSLGGGYSDWKRKGRDGSFKEAENDDEYDDDEEMDYSD